jgi:2,3-bisphosphoglycerate-dependent phosphoglycerate mutase
VFLFVSSVILHVPMGKLVLVRHGESRWNLCNRFTGWVDVPLSENGVNEAERCAKHCQEFSFSAVFTSTLERAQETALIILSRQNRNAIFQHKGDDPRYRTWIKASNVCGGDDIPIVGTPLLNERYYGALQGMDKYDAEAKYGHEKVLAWRRGYKDRPPKGESLADVFARVWPYFRRHVLPRANDGETVLLSGHGNTLRAIIKHLEGISDQDIAAVDLPEAKPLVYEAYRSKLVRVEGGFALDRPLR